MKKFKVKEGIEIAAKRFYMPGIVLNMKCKKCGEIMEKDFDREYLSYPEIGENDEGICCYECGTDHNFKVNLSVSIEFDENTLEIYT